MEIEKSSMKNLLLLLTCLFCCTLLHAQQTLSGKIEEAKSGIPLLGATITLTSKNPQAKPQYTTSDESGQFVIENAAAAPFQIQVTFVGFKMAQKNFDTFPEKGRAGIFYMKEDAILLNEVVAKGRHTRATQKGDTLAYNAAAFKTAQGSSTEDLITKMPGILVEGGKIEAQGEQIKRIFVDGKAFFEGDPTLALRTLPADLVESIEVFDKQSDDAQFAGFDNGETQKSINIRTRNPLKAKQFGRASIGMGTDMRYQFNGNYNYFKNARRISILAMSNNVNQQNFSQEDIAGVMQDNSRKVNRKGSSQTMLGQLPGVTNTTALGINYADKWGEKVDVQASYFFNYSHNDVQSDTYRQYYDTIPYVRQYSEQYDGNTHNSNHRFNMKLTYNINERNAIMFQPMISYQDNHTRAIKLGETYRDDSVQNKTLIDTDNRNKALNLQAGLQYRHRFEKPGRMFSVSTTVNRYRNHADNGYFSITDYQIGTIRTDSVERVKDNVRKNYRLRGMVNYNEPLSKTTSLNLNYRVNYTHNDADNYTYRIKREEDLMYQLLDTALTNVFESDYITQTGGLGIRHYNKEKKLSLYASVNVEHAKLHSEQIFPALLDTKKDFLSVLPFMRFDYKINPQNALRMMVRGSSKEPSITQLQNNINDSNPLMVTGGNPNLKQETSYMISSHYTLTAKAGYTFFTMLGATVTNNYIGSSTQIIEKPTEIAPNVILQEGAQYTIPTNFNGSWGANALMTLGVPIDFIKSNLNFTTSFRYNLLPGMYNEMKQTTNDYSVTPGMVLSSNISDKLDFTLSYFARLNFFENSFDAQRNNSFINQTASAKLNWEFWKGFVFETNFSYEKYTGMTDGYNQNFYLLNAALGRRFLRSKRLEAKITANDILKQNQSIRREVSSNYYQDITSNVLKPYVMFSLTYDLRLFPGGKRGGGGKDKRPPFSPNGMGRPDGPPMGGGHF